MSGAIVLDDAVVDDGDGAVAAEVRVGVAVGGAAVRGPARVADAEAAGGGMRGEVLGQFGEPAGLLAQVQFVARAGDDAGAVVAAIFQPPQPFEQDRRRLALPRVPDDPAHASAPSHAVERMGML